MSVDDTPLATSSAAAGDVHAPAADRPGALPWQRTMLASLFARRAQWPHALLVTGPAGIGKRILAEALAGALLCEAPRGDASACGGCPGCRYVAAGQHPDLRIVEPVEIDEDEVKSVEWISVDRIRALIRWAEITSHRGGAKVALIVPAERMNEAAANALLKTLEEPPRDTYFLLVSHLPGRLPATITSRCQRIVAPRPTREDARAWLSRQDVPGADSALAQANDAPLRARALADADYQAERDTWIRALAAPDRLEVAALGARIDAVPRDRRKERLAGVVDWLCGWCVDLARVRVGSAPAQNAASEAALRELARAVAPLALFRYHRQLLRQRALLAHPLSPRLVAEALLIDYRALFG